MEKSAKIYIAGHNGMVGSAIHRNLIEKGFNNFVFSPFPPYDLTNQEIVGKFFEKEKPEYVFLAAAKVGGILSNNTYRAQFLYENLMIQNNIIHQSYLHAVKKLLFLGSSCIYPKNCPQPIKEEYLLTGELEHTNEPYAIAKISGIKMCEAYNLQYGTNFISVMPTNLYGPNDNYNLETSHVLPALIRKLYLGKCLENNDWVSIRKDLKKYPIDGCNVNSSEIEILEILNKYGIQLTTSTEHPALSTQQPVTITLWGTGSPFREFLYVDDLAEACVYVMDNIDFSDLTVQNHNPQTLNSMPSDFRPRQSAQIKNTHINIGTGQDQTIRDLAIMIKNVANFSGELMWDNTKPDGTFRKLLDISKINSLGWREKTSLKTGIEKIYLNYSK